MIALSAYQLQILLLHLRKAGVEGSELGYH
jgi:hypothetical protein